MDIAGGEFPTEIVMVAVLTPPSASSARAVIVCEPLDSERVKWPPLPIGPSTLEDHWMLLVKSPSSKSLAVPRNVIGSLVAKELPPEGAWIATVGKEFVTF